MKLFRSTKTHTNYWKNKKADWKVDYLATENHPHRKVIVGALKQIPWFSLLEMGCNAGPNLSAIVRAIPGRQLGGVDLSADAIKVANETFTGSYFRVGSADDVMMSDKSVDVVLSDMTYIYVSPSEIDKYVIEAKRLARNYLVLCEFHSTNWWNRLAVRLNSGYHMHNWEKLLDKHGFYDISLYKLKPQDWPGGGLQEKFGYIILAKLPKRG